MIIQHNIMALNSYNRLSGNNSLISKNLEKLSSGYKINRAGDDAAGLAISEKMRAQITGLTRATQNAQDGVSLVQTAEGNLTEVHSMLNRMVDLATQASNGTIDNDVDRKNLQKEVQSLKDEINRIADSSHFNGIKLLDGSMGNKGSVKDVAFSGSKLNFSTKAGKLEVTGTSLTVKISGNDTPATVAAGEIKVNFAAAGELQIELGTNGATAQSFSAEEITQAVRDAARKYMTDNVATPTSAQYQLAKEASSFSMTADKDIALAGGATTTATSGSMAAATPGLSLQIGDTSAQRVTVQVDSMDIASLGLQEINVSTEAGAVSAIDKIKTAINTVSGTRADLGAIQNRLEHTINNLSTTTENMTAAESRIRDTDMAKEMMAFTKNNVLSQAAQAMLAQANQQPQQVLQLLR